MRLGNRTAASPAVPPGQASVTTDVRPNSARATASALADLCESVRKRSRSQAGAGVASRPAPARRLAPGIGMRLLPAVPQAGEFPPPPLSPTLAAGVAWR